MKVFGNANVGFNDENMNTEVNLLEIIVGVERGVIRTLPVTILLLSSVMFVMILLAVLKMMVKMTSP